MSDLRLIKRLIRVKLDARYTVWLNLLTGAVDLVANDSPLNTLECGSCVDSYFVNKYKDLCQRGYFLTYKKENSLYRQLLRMYKSYLKHNKFIHVVFIPTSICNFSCPYCINYLSRLSITSAQKKASVMTPLQVQKAFDFIDDLRSKGAEVCNDGVGLYGGEPLLDICIPFLEKLSNEARKRKLTVSVITNGFFTARVRKLIGDSLDVFRYMKFTLDGPKDVHNQRRTTITGTDTFETIAQNIDWALSNNLVVDIRSNLDSTNVDHYHKLADFFVKKNWHTKVNIFQVSPVRNNFSGNNEVHPFKEKFISEMYRAIKKFANLDELRIKENIISRYAEPIYSLFLDKDACGSFEYIPHFSHCATAEGRTLNFAWDGKIYTCFNGVGEKAFVIGSYYPEAILDSKACKFWSNYWRVGNPKECKECNYSLVCGGPCPYSYYLGGNKTEFCGYIKEYFDDSVRAAKNEIYDCARATGGK